MALEFAATYKILVLGKTRFTTTVTGGWFFMVFSFTIVFGITLTLLSCLLFYHHHPHRSSVQPFRYIAGDSNVGKTCIVHRYCDERYYDTYISTIGIDFKQKLINLDGVPIKLQIWDTGLCQLSIAICLWGLMFITGRPTFMMMLLCGL